MGKPEKVFIKEISSYSLQISWLLPWPDSASWLMAEWWRFRWALALLLRCVVCITCVTEAAFAERERMGEEGVIVEVTTQYFQVLVSKLDIILMFDRVIATLAPSLELYRCLALSKHLRIYMFSKWENGVPGCLSAEHVTLDLGVVSSSSTLGAELTLKKKELIEILQNN